jgi:DNA-binding MarR family transcriptional regulator
MKKSSEPDPDLAALPLGLLLGRLAGQFRRALSAHLDDEIEDIRLLGVLLAIRADPAAPQASHAAFLGVDVNTARRLFDTAEAAGLLRRAPAPGDRRAHVLELTEHGARRAAAGAQAVAEVEAGFTASLDPEDAARFRAVAERLLRANNAAGSDR